LYTLAQRPARLIQTLALLLTCCTVLVLPARAQQTTSINFRDADINSLIESVAQVTGRSFVVDPRVSGTVTIIAPEPIDSSMLYQAFLSALQVQGFQAVEDGAVVRIVPLNQAYGVAPGGMNELETRLIRVEHVDAGALVAVVKPLLTATARLQAFSDSNYLIVSDTRSNVEQLVDVIAVLDDPSQSALEVFDLQYISAGEAVHIVEQLQGVLKESLSVVEDSLNNRVIISGPGAARSAFKNMLLTIDVPTTRQGGVEVIFLNYAKAQDLKVIIDGMLQSTTFLLVAGESDGNTKYRVEVDDANNALVVAAAPGVIREVQAMVQKLDRSRPQVLVEAVIAELSEKQARRLSAQLVYANRDSGAYLSKFDNVLTTLLGVGTGVSTATSLSVLDQVEGGVAGAGNFDADTGAGFGLLIQALKSDGSTRVLSTPSIMTLDNEEASLSIGNEVPFITGSFTTNGEGSNNPFQTITRQEVGIKLKVQPQIGDGDTVRLAISQESSKLLGDAGRLGTSDVVTSKSTITTNVLISDGEILVLGGLMNDQQDQTVARVPVLGSIPVVGGLFRASSNNDDQSVLMMFIRPTIIRDASSAKEASNRKFDYLVNHQLSGETEEGDSLAEKLQEFNDAR
jgi:general secretion pathway protein D